MNCQGVLPFIYELFFEMSFKENVKKQLAYSGMLMKELAAATGISLHTIETYLNVRACAPSAENAYKIARAFGVSVEYLLTGKRDVLCAMPRTPEGRRVAQCVDRLDAPTRQTVVAMVEALGEPRHH
jgi:transcriptional regulator with XRE-family HTH domain